MKKKLKKQEGKKNKILKSISKLKNKISAKEKKLSKIDVKIAGIEKKAAEKKAKASKDPRGNQIKATPGAAKKTAPAKKYNVGVSKGGVSFKEAFKYYKGQGNKTFTWNGKKYTTDVKKAAPKAKVSTPTPADFSTSAKKAAPKAKKEEPKKEEEKSIIRHNIAKSFPKATAILKPEDIIRAREVVKDVYLDEKIKKYILSIHKRIKKCFRSNFSSNINSETKPPSASISATFFPFI